jgi:hypothetical protein
LLTTTATPIRAITNAIAAVSLVLGFAGCSGEVDTEARTLRSGRQIDVFRVFTTDSSKGPMLHYFYITRHFREPAEFEREWSEVLDDAQAEADKRKASELMLVGSERDAWLIARLFREVERTRFFRKEQDHWVEVPFK